MTRLSAPQLDRMVSCWGLHPICSKQQHPPQVRHAVQISKPLQVMSAAASAHQERKLQTRQNTGWQHHARQPALPSTANMPHLEHFL
jgi:hypothetical protein